MDVLSEIWLSSVTSALFFFSGGRLWGKAAAIQRALEPLVGNDRAARRKAEEQAASVRVQAAAEIRRLTEIAERREREAAELRARVEELTQALSAAGSARAAEREAHAAPVSVALGEPPISATPLPARPTSDHRLEAAITDHLEALRAHDGTWRTAVLSDMRGLLIASSGDVRHDDDLGAAAALTSDAAFRLRQILPLSDPVELRLVDANNVVLTTRWLRGEHDGLLLSTLGVAAARPDPHADALHASISNLLRWT